MGVICGFLRLTSPEMETALRELHARTDTRGGERVERTLALVAGEVELYSGKHQSVPAWRTLGKNSPGSGHVGLVPGRLACSRLEALKVLCFHLGNKASRSRRSFPRDQELAPKLIEEDGNELSVCS